MPIKISNTGLLEDSGFSEIEIDLDSNPQKMVLTTKDKKMAKEIYESIQTAIKIAHYHDITPKKFKPYNVFPIYPKDTCIVTIQGNLMQATLSLFSASNEKNQKFISKQICANIIVLLKEKSLVEEIEKEMKKQPQETTLSIADSDKTIKDNGQLDYNLALQEVADQIESDDCLNELGKSMSSIQNLFLEQVISFFSQQQKFSAADIGMLVNFLKNFISVLNNKLDVSALDFNNRPSAKCHFAH